MSSKVGCRMLPGVWAQDGCPRQPGFPSASAFYSWLERPCPSVLLERLLPAYARGQLSRGETPETIEPSVITSQHQRLWLLGPTEHPQGSTVLALCNPEVMCWVHHPRAEPSLRGRLASKASHSPSPQGLDRDELEQGGGGHCRGAEPREQCCARR